MSRNCMDKSCSVLVNVLPACLFSFICSCYLSRKGSNEALKNSDECCLAKCLKCFVCFLSAPLIAPPITVHAVIKKSWNDDCAAGAKERYAFLTFVRSALDPDQSIQKYCDALAPATNNFRDPFMAGPGPMDMR